MNNEKTVGEYFLVVPECLLTTALLKHHGGPFGSWENTLRVPRSSQKRAHEQENGDPGSVRLPAVWGTGHARRQIAKFSLQEAGYEER